MFPSLIEASWFFVDTFAQTGMTAAVFDSARTKGTVDRVGQLNPMGRYGVAEGE